MSVIATRLFSEEDGVMFVLFAALASAVILIGAFVIGIGKWREHERHLQLQVDSGALAAGTEFTGCFQDPTQTNADIARVARQYAGDPTFASAFPGFGSSFNPQVDRSDRVKLGLNRPSYPPPSGDFDPFYDINPALAGVQNLPCDALILDVKAVDEDVPALLGGFVPTPSSIVDLKARARVEIRQVEELNGFLPWAIPEVDPTHIAVVFINEGNGELIRAFELTEGTTTVLNGTPVTQWNGSQADLDVKNQTGMIVVISRLGSDASDPGFSVGGSLASICTQQKTACYAGNTTADGIMFVRANETAAGGSVSDPVLGEVSLTPGTCTEDSAPYFLVDADCRVGVRATVSFGPTCGANPEGNPCNARVTAIGAGCGGSTSLSFSGGVWSATCGNPRIAQNSGQNPVRISWSSNPPGPGSFSGTFPDSPAARVYAKDDNAGPIEFIRVVPNPAAGGGPQPVSVTVGVPPSLRVSGKLDPPILLRFKQRNGPNTQQVDCDPSPRGSDEELATGCETFYDDDEDGICPPEYDEGNELPPNTPPNPPNPVPTCAAVRPGSVISMNHGLEERWQNGAFPLYSKKNCPPNNWPDNASEDIPGSGDPRWVILIVTDISSFKAPPGQDPVVPIVKWAGFYVTGWDDSSSTPGCPDNPATPKSDGNDPHPLGFGSNRDNGDVWGHFVNYVPFLPGATASEKFCNFSEIGICVAVLTQ